MPGDRLEHGSSCHVEIGIPRGGVGCYNDARSGLVPVQIAGNDVLVLPRRRLPSGIDPGSATQHHLNKPLSLCLSEGYGVAAALRAGWRGVNVMRPAAGAAGGL